MASASVPYSDVSATAKERDDMLCRARYDADTEDIWKRALAEWDELDASVPLPPAFHPGTHAVVDDSVVKDWKQMHLNGHNYWWATNYKNGSCLKILVV